MSKTWRVNEVTKQSSKGTAENNGLKVSAHRQNHIPALIVDSLLPSSVTKYLTSLNLVYLSLQWRSEVGAGLNEMLYSECSAMPVTY